LGVGEETTPQIIEQIKSQVDCTEFQIPPLSLVQKYLNNPTTPDVIPVASEKIIVVSSSEKEKPKEKEKEKEKETDSKEALESKAKKLSKGFILFPFDIVR
jgi:hypothetical protein